MNPTRRQRASKMFLQATPAIALTFAVLAWALGGWLWAGAAVLVAVVGGALAGPLGLLIGSLVVPIIAIVVRVV